MNALIRQCLLLRRVSFGLCLLAGLWLLPLQAADYQSHQLSDDGLVIQTSEGQLTLRFHQPAVVEAFYQTDGVKQLPSFTLPAEQTLVAADLEVQSEVLRYGTEALTVLIDKASLQLSYERHGKVFLAEEQGLFQHDTLRGFRFQLQPDEKLMGAGQRVLGMDRRGHRLPLYNKADYGYTTESEQMYFSLPAVLSSNNYMLLFDNSASGFIDLGKTEADVLQFEAVGGRTGYIVAAGESYQHTLQQYLQASGMPPLPPRWALGNYASRFGYRTEQEARDTVQRFIDQGFPLDAIVLDLYWFGPGIQGHMGNLAWDKEAFPNPEQMIADFRELGVKTILITEPFILTSSNRWQEAVDEQVLALNLAGKPKTFDFYFGNTGLIDVFKPEAAEWFWQIYHELMQQGVAGWWGDLGEPEVHPHDTIHQLPGGTATADEIHNADGHEWAKMVFDRHVRDYPALRPFIMMRSGAPGSQRYGMIPWTGDVDRSWGGLEPQVELALQMSLFGFGYIHSDLGGFAGGEQFDAEMYTRWMQYGVFQPVYRPHAQEHIAPEPVFHDGTTQRITRDFIYLRYRMLPYNYTLAYQHSTLGLPLMRPLFYLEPDNPAFIDERNSYLWGDAFLVAPVTEPGVTEWTVNAPAGVWFDFFDGRRYQGGQSVQVPVTLETIPVLVKAGAFVPMVAATQSTDQYSSEQLELHYWHDASVGQSKGEMYEDDGISRTSLQDGAYELLQFSARNQQDEKLELTLTRQGDYPGMPAERHLMLVVHQAPDHWQQVQVDGQTFKIQAESVAKGEEGAWRNRDGAIVVQLNWQQGTQLSLN